MKKRLRVFCIYIAIICLVVSTYAKAQNTQTDTIPPVEINESELDRIIDIRKQFDIQNSTYSVPSRSSSDPYYSVKRGEPRMSPEAMYWVQWKRDPATAISPYATFRDTIIADPAFLPPIFRGNILPDDMNFYDGHVSESKNKDPYAFMYETDTTLFADYRLKKKTNDELQTYLEKNNLSSFNYSERDLPGETVKTKIIRKPVYENVVKRVEPEIVKPDELESIPKFIPDRRYWKSAFSSSIQFSQNHVSENWHQGGTSSMHLFTRNHLKYDYEKDKVKFTNEVELKIGFNNAPKDTLRNYRIADNLLRIYSTFGYKAFSNWHYTITGDLRTPFFKSFKENTNNVVTAFMAPLSFSTGIGMKYGLTKKSKKPNKNIALNFDLLPLSVDLKYTINDEIDFASHGFKKDTETGEYDHLLAKFGSTVNANMTLNFNKNVSLWSRLLYFTSYEMVKVEFENRLTMKITRNFNTQLYVYLRHDDTAKKDDNLGYFQLNELLSLGFTYSW